jgi:hypothetical protein
MSDLLFGQFKRSPRTSFRLLTALVLTGLLAAALLKALERPEAQILPVQFRVKTKSLSDLPVRIDHIQSCSCWFGPRDQAQRKYKFRIVNETNHVINIDGGTNSVIRLVVAYPNHKEPRLTMPVATNDMPMQRFGSPPDESVAVSRKIEPVRPSEIKNENKFFGVPEDYSVWALPASPNKVAEIIGGNEGSFPTVVDKDQLLPDEEYEGHHLGHGTWTFYIPLPHRFASRFKPGYEPLLAHAQYEKYVIFVGIGAFDREGGALVNLLGFAPAPSEDAFKYPYEL